MSFCEDLRPVPGVQDDEAHAGEHVAVDALDDLVGDLAVGGVAPPGEDVGLGEHLLGQAVLGVVERRGAHDGALAEVGLDALGDRAVHAVRVALRPRSGSSCSWRFSPHTVTRIGRSATLVGAPSVTDAASGRRVLGDGVT